MRFVSLAVLAACGGHGNTPPEPLPCTPEAQGVVGTKLVVEQVDLGFGVGAGVCQQRLLASAADRTAAFPNNDAPAQVKAVDFAVDRVVIGASNPVVQFAVDDGAAIVVGEEQLCQGAAPSCTAHIVRGTVRNSLAVDTCPYRGPDPCLAP